MKRFASRPFAFRLFLSLGVTLCLTLYVSTPASARPNVIYLLADDLGYGELGCYGQTQIQTPHIDQLAREGMRFTQHYAGAPVCAPSRCVLMTGKHLGHAFIRDNREHKPEGQLPIPAGEITLAECFRSANYATGAMGKWGLGFPGSDGDPNHQGFQLFFGYNCQRHAHNHYPTYVWRNDQRIELPGNTGGATGQTHTQNLFIAEAKQFIRDHAQENFFLFMPFTVPHVSIQVPDSELEPYAGKIEETPYEHKDGYKPHPTPHAGYAAMVSFLDKGIGEILELLEELNLADNTIVMFSSDNGPTHGRVGGADSQFFHSAGPLRGLKGSVYEGGIRVPLIVRWPNKIAAGSESDHVSGFQDIMPTVLEAIGEQPPESIDGISFLPTLLGQTDQQQQHEYLVWHFPGYGGQQAVRMGDWKGLRRDRLRKNPKAIELYNLSEDVGEQKNVAAQHPEVVAQIRQIMTDTQAPSENFPLVK